MDEEESFQLALAMSQSEAEEKERQKKMLTQKYAMSSFLSAPTSDPLPVRSMTESSLICLLLQSVPENHHDYSELSKYIERGRQEKVNPPNISNGHSVEITSTLPVNTNGTSTERTEFTFLFQDDSNHFITDGEIDQFTTLVNDHINNFKFRMLSNQQRNRNITNDTAVQSVFVMLQHYYPELNRHMQLLEEKRGKRRRGIANINCLFSFIEAYYENLQDKLNQLKDAREALNALRSEHHERKQQEAQERERQRQIQLAQKLDFMRQKKQVRWTKNTSIERIKMI